MSCDTLLLRNIVCEWNQTNDSHQSGGTSSSASSVLDCQNACISNPLCTGIDWDQINTPHCWLTWYSGNSYLSGATHFDINRSSCHIRKYSFLGSILLINNNYNDSNKLCNIVNAFAKNVHHARMQDYKVV